MKTVRYLRLLIASVVCVAGLAAAPATPEGSWKTAFYKRGFVGKYSASWAGGKAGEGVVRLPVTLPFDGTQVRVWLRSDRDIEIALNRLSLAPGVDRQGGTDGRFFPVSFDGAPGVTIEPKKKDFVSAASAMPIRAGLWYLQQHYTSAQYLYAYDADGFFRVDDEQQPAVGPDAFRKGSWVGNVYRIDVFTTDPRPVVVCYGDSITQGAGATAGTGNRYPALLGDELKRPVLNLGVNGDLAKFARGMPGLVGTLDGVDTVVFLMGINDIISGALASADDYVKNLTGVAEAVKKGGRKFYIGTILPSGGYAKFDAAPEKETLRQSLNAWIRSQSVADGVIDFDEALRDPKDPVRMRADCQGDWLHPNDAGYRRMANAAAAVLR